MAQNFGMIANYADKMKSMTTEGVKIRTCHGARDEETTSRSIRRRQSYRRRREGHDGISIKNNKVE
jgi:hypothetical protein